jgi:SAM-dependent methyltransferase
VPQGAVPELSASDTHDPTLKWILSDHMDLGQTPEPIEQPPARPVAFVARAATTEVLAVPKGAKTPPPWIYSLNEKTTAAPRRTDADRGPPPDEIIAAKASPARQALTAQVSEPATPKPVLASEPAPSGAYMGATPSDFFGSDPTPPRPNVQLTEEDLGMTPASVASGPSGSDSELSADSVELLPASSDESPARASAPAQEPRHSPTHGEGMPASPPEGTDSSTLEPREVEPEAVMMMVDSSEHVLETTVAQPRSWAAGSTPPPVPPDLALAAPSRTLTPENHGKAAVGGSTEAAAIPQRLPDIPVLSTQRVSPEGLGAKPAQTHPETPTPRVSPPPVSQTLAATLFEEYQTPASSSDAVPEALARRSLHKRSKPWYEEVFDDDYLRTVPFMTPDQTTREVNFIRDVLEVRTGGEVLDVGCGYGRHAIEMAQHGVQMTGLDLSLPLLIKAADHAQKRGLSVNFVHADMREITFSAQFDAAYCVLSSFGYFDEETNLRVATAICRSLKPGGRFLLDILNRDYIVGDLPSRVWWEGDGCVILEEVDFNYHTSRVLIRRSVVFGNGRQSEQELSMRAYSLHEVGRLLRQAGLRVLDVSGGLATKSKFFGAASRNIIAVCERPMP